jgi:hypothetical protein
MAQGPRFSLRLNQPCRRFITNSKDHNHGYEEEEGQEENQVVSGRPRIGATLSISDFARFRSRKSGQTLFGRFIFLMKNPDRTLFNADQA